MVAGVQLTSIGSLNLNDRPRLVAAGGGLAIGLSAVGYMIFRTSRLLTDEWITLAQLELEGFKRQLHVSSRRRDKRRGLAIDRIYEELQGYQDELYGGVAESISDLYSRLIKPMTRPGQSRTQSARRRRRTSGTLLTCSCRRRITPTPALTSPCSAGDSRRRERYSSSGLRYSHMPPTLRSRQRRAVPLPRSVIRRRAAGTLASLKPLDQPRDGTTERRFGGQDIDHVQPPGSRRRAMLTP